MGAASGLVAFALLWGGMPAQAFQLEGEWYSFEPGEALAFDTPQKLGSEYSSDYLTYLKPLKWQGVWLRNATGIGTGTGTDTDIGNGTGTGSGNAYELSVGSVSSYEFQLDQRLQVARALTDNLGVRLTWYEDRNLEQNFSGYWLTLSYRLTPRFSVLGFGQLEHEKKENDVGMAIEFRPSAAAVVRVSRVFPDFDLNQRNRAADRWVKGHHPTVYSLRYSQWLGQGAAGVIGGNSGINALESSGPKGSLGAKTNFSASSRDSASSADFIDSWIRWEPELISQQPTVSQYYTHSRWAAQSLGVMSWGSARHSLEWRFFVDHKIEKQKNYDASNRSRSHGSLGVSDSGSRRRVFLTLADEFLVGALAVRPGINVFLRDYTRKLVKAHTVDLLPNFWVMLPEIYKKDLISQWAIGIDSTWYKIKSDLDFGLPETQAAESEQRLNIRYDVKFSRQSQLGLLFTFDLDRLATSEAWEGGGGQFSMVF